MRPVTKFRNQSTERVFDQIVQNDRLFDDLTDNLGEIVGLDEATQQLKNTLRMYLPEQIVQAKSIEWELLTKSLIPTV